MTTQKALDPVELARLTLKEAVLDVIEFRGETTIVIDRDHIVDACAFFKETEGLEYIYLSDIAGIDYYQQEPSERRFAANYHLYSFAYNRRLRLKVYAPEDDPRIPSVSSVYPAADWEEREAYDMFGILFEGHPSLRRVLMPDDWDGHPQRKDYPLGYEQVQFSFNFDDIDRLKPYAKE
ncbi:MAG TPA: NADH-quinone oxidoreductase subunit C [Aggregatilineales bacterium]|nr:NADH-quinone oxidoreductase subunit C [Anaerolineales bacterium]HRE47495.1 NADH-quinone oxidoreductase subunit C [Aggregatilineales bacterium]